MEFFLLQVGKKEAPTVLCNWLFPPGHYSAGYCSQFTSSFCSGVCCRHAEEQADFNLR